MPQKIKSAKILAFNRSARFHFELLSKFEGGLVLTGPEVKSLKTQSAKLAGAFLKITKKQEVLLLNLQIAKYRFAQNQPQDPWRPRLVLLKKKEIKNLKRSLQEKGTTLIPLSLRLKGNLIKLTLATARGKKKFEKRAVLKKRAIEREVARQLKN